MLHLSTFSIVAWDPNEGAWGVAVASKFLAVGAVVPWARAGAGAIATQSYANTSFGPLGLEMLEKGRSAQETLENLLSTDLERETRQVGIVDARGGAATFSGVACQNWAGGVIGNGFAVQGNILAGPDVVPAMAAAFQAAPGSIHWRLHQALIAGDRAGGDRRGRQSAAILVVKPKGGYGGFNDRWLDLRVDDHPAPLQGLHDLLEIFDLYFQKSPDQDRVYLRGEPLRDLQALLIKLGEYRGAVHGEFDTATRESMRSFIGKENFEERADCDAGWIDRPVLDYLLRKFQGNS